jgi:MOSC domain-containing protein YiiM
MKVVSTNLGEAVEVKWRGKLVKTGIYKYPVNEAIWLGKKDVVNDHVIDRKYHGGISKACYFFSADHYDEWKKSYPNLNWDFGMFGENITVTGMDERQVRIGDRYRLGKAVIRITEPRQPCFKLGVRFETQAVLKDFISRNHCGFYAAVEEEGEVAPNDHFELLEEGPQELSVANVFRLLYKVQAEDLQIARKALLFEPLPVGCKAMIQRGVDALS